MIFLVVVFFAGIVSGVTAAIAGFGIGSLMTPLSLLTFSLAPAAFVATSTAVGLAIDAARMPIYAWRAGPALLTVLTPISVATVGVLIGTLWGERLLFGLSPESFRRVVAILIGVLGLWLIVK